MSEEKKDAGFFAPYSSFASKLRGWLIGFGIGAPVLLLTNEKIFLLFSADPATARKITFLFIFGCAIQVLLAFIYMVIMSYFHLNETAVNAYNKTMEEYRYKKMDKTLRTEKRGKARKVLSDYNQPYRRFLIMDWISESWKLEALANALTILLFLLALIDAINLILPLAAATTGP